MTKRPSTNESDIDTLKLQEEFLLKKGKQDLLNQIKKNQRTEEVEKEDLSSLVCNTFERIPVDHSLKIIERREGDHRPPKQYKGKPRAITSVFAKKLLAANPPPQNEPMDISEPTCLQESISSQKPTTRCLSDRDNEEIHRENVHVLEEMTPEQIQEERERLLSSMDPEIAKFLKSKRKVKAQTGTPEIFKQNEAGRTLTLDDLETTKELIEQPGAKTWLNFDHVETCKLAWMSSIDVPKHKEGEAYHARFDFNGYILPFTLPEINESNRKLYHHGEEPGRPGYTLQELFQLCRSGVNQQRVVALNTIANILNIYQYGMYDKIFDLPLEQIFFMLRISLDENVPAVLSASVKAVRNLFYRVIDETCLDNLNGYGLGTVQPILAIDEEDDDTTVNDQQLAETNLVKCLMRTNIFNRMRYIVNTLKPATDTIIYCLEILIRLARDSTFVVDKMLENRSLLEGIMQYFVAPFKSYSTKSEYGQPLAQAIKLLRILGCRNNKFAGQLLNRYKIMDSVASYLGNEELSQTSDGLKLQIEAMNFWNALLLQDLATDYFRLLEGTILKNFHHQVEYISLQTTFVNQAYVSAILNVLQIALNKKLVRENLQQLSEVVQLAIRKWTFQFCNLEQWSCGLLQINTSLLKFHAHQDDVILSLLQSQGFLKTTEWIKRGSNLLSSHRCHQSSSNLKIQEAAVWEAQDHIIPVLCSQSCMPFLSVLSEAVANCSSKEVKLRFINHPNVQKYISDLNAMPTYNLVANWFTRIETQFIANILKSAVAVQDDIDTSVFYEIAVKCLSTFNSQQKHEIMFIFSRIIFSTSFYPCTTLMKHLDLSDSDMLLKKALGSLEDVLNVYSKILNLKSDSDLKLAIDATDGNVIPVDWVYSPIIVLYSSNQETNQKLSEEEQIYITKNCLHWLYIYETYFPQLASMIDPTDRFCRLACTFLVSDLFLNPEIKDLLTVGFKNLLVNIDKINFEKNIQGLGNFQQLYIQLLEQYQAHGYGDVLFGNFILLPLIQRNKPIYRETLWSEYWAVVEVLNITQEQVMSPVELYLNPPETDTKILKQYKSALLKMRSNSFLKGLAAHHLKQYLLSKNITLPSILK